MKDITNKMAKGVAWMIAIRMVDRGIGFISTIILARLLVPDDFGLIAMATAIIAVLELITSFNFNMALIHNQRATSAHYNTAWTFNFFFAFGSGLILILLAEPAAGFYQEPRLEYVIYFLSLAQFINAFENIGIVDFQKNLQFDKEFRMSLIKKIVGFSITISLAIVYRSYWALLAGMLSMRITTVILSYLMHPFRPRFSVSEREELFHFSKWLFFNNIIMSIRLRAADFIVGRLAGTHALGLYNLAYEISNLPTAQIVAPINRAVYPGYVKMASDLSVLRTGYLSVISMIALAAVPIGTGIALVADTVVPLLLGEKWLDSAPLITILSVYGVAIAMQSNTFSIYVALGHPRLWTILQSLHLIVLVPAVVTLTLKNGVTGAAWGYLLTALVMAPFNYTILLRLLSLKFLRLLSFVWRPFIASLGMFSLVRMLPDQGAHLDDTVALASQLGMMVSVGVISYVTLIWLLWLLSGKPDGAERYVLRRILPIAQRILPKAKSLRDPAD